MMIKKTLILFTLLLFLFSSESLARSFSSDNYNLDWGNFNITGGKKTSTSFTLTDSVGQNAPGQFDSSGYILKSGFQYAYDQSYQFSFEINDLDIEFGTLTPNIGTTQSNIITISTPTGNGYQILASQNRPLSNIGNNTTIPDTTCDNGTCTHTNSSIWTESDTYGFGFNAIGVNSSQVVTDIGTSNYFTDSTYFRQFADLSNNEEAQIIMSENNPVNEHSAKITYKVNISSNQAAGTYQNSINFIAVPKY